MYLRIVSDLIARKGRKTNQLQEEKAMRKKKSHIRAVVCGKQ